jgi:hypothetical protein
MSYQILIVRRDEWQFAVCGVQKNKRVYLDFDFAGRFLGVNVNQLDVSCQEP